MKNFRSMGMIKKNLALILVGTIVKLNSSIHAMDYAPFCDETYSLPYHQEPYQTEKDKPLTREDYFDLLLNKLSDIQEIYDFDPHILDNEPNEQIKIVPKKDTTFLTKILSFYSEDYSERRKAFKREIKTPLRNILKDATEEPYYDFAQSLKALVGLLPHSNTPLFDIAIRDIFNNSLKGLVALERALRYFRDNGELDQHCRQNLFLFNKIAGFYFDPKAISYIIDLNDCVMPPQTPLARLAFLRVLQVEGELFKYILPSTLNLAKLPPEKILRRLRSKLAHLNKHKLKKLLKMQEVDSFVSLAQDLAIINQSLKKIESHFISLNQRNPVDLWGELKGRQEQ